MATEHTIALGIDIGGSGIKGAPVDLVSGEIIRERYKIPTPQPSTPEAVGEAVAAIADYFKDVIPGDAPVGITFPGIVQHGVIRLVANLDQGWLDYDADTHFTERLGRPVHICNDGDAAGVAEVRYGAGRGKRGLVVMTTLGTGIGVALIHNGVLIPNAEFGHLELDGHDAESRAAASAKQREGLTYEKWATTRLQPYYAHLEMLLSPDLFIVGGGVSRKSHKFLPLLNLRTPILTAQLRNAAGIVGAAAVAADEAAAAD